MRAAIWYGPGEMSVDEVPSPKIEPDEVLLRVKAVGICGSELSGFLGHNSLRRPPLVMGHEFTGVVVQTGSDVERLSLGDRVTVNPLVPDGTCVLCRNGFEQLCLNRSLIGAHRPGALAEYVAVPAKACFPLPHDVDDTSGTLVEPLACSLHAVNLAMVQPASRVLVLGAGPIGLLTLAAARRAGATYVAVSDVNPLRLEMARVWGATQLIDPSSQDLAGIIKDATDDLGCDCAIDAVGLPDTRRQAVESVRPGGRVIFLGLHEDEVILSGNDIVRSEVSVQGSFCYTHADFWAAIRLLRTDFLPSSESWVTIRQLDEAHTSFSELVKSDVQVAKVVLSLQSPD